jgi:hypothetical protein
MPFCWKLAGIRTVVAMDAVSGHRRSRKFSSATHRACRVATHEQGDRQDRFEQQLEGGALHFWVALLAAIEKFQSITRISHWPHEFYRIAGQSANLVSDVIKFTHRGKFKLVSRSTATSAYVMEGLLPKTRHICDRSSDRFFRRL